MTKLYCPYIWKELLIENDGYISPCVHSTNKLSNTSIIHQDRLANIATAPIHQNLDGLVEMRNLMNNGVWPKQCVNCQSKEAKNLLSPRLKAVTNYLNSTKVELKHLILRVGNVCNLRCIMCGPWASNQWYNDYVELNDSIEFKNNQNLYLLDKKPTGDFYLRDSRLNSNDWETVVNTVLTHSNELETISFHGGEPMVSKIHYKIIDALIKNNKAADMQLEYYTSFYQIPEHFFNLVDKFKQITFNISLDGIADINDAIRWPSKYAEIENNIKRMQSISNVKLKINHTVNILNCEHVIDFLTHNLQFDINLNFVREPLYSSIRILDAADIMQLKQILAASNNDLYQQYNLGMLIDSTVGISISESSKQQHRLTFVKMWDQFSTKQEQDWKKLFPFAYNLYIKWKTA